MSFMRANEGVKRGKESLGMSTIPRNGPAPNHDSPVASMTISANSPARAHGNTSAASTHHRLSESVDARLWAAWWDELQRYMKTLPTVPASEIRKHTLKELVPQYRPRADSRGSPELAGNAEFEMKLLDRMFNADSDSEHDVAPAISPAVSTVKTNDWDSDDEQDTSRKKRNAMSVVPIPHFYTPDPVIPQQYDERFRDTPKSGRSGPKYSTSTHQNSSPTPTARFTTPASSHSHGSKTNGRLTPGAEFLSARSDKTGLQTNKSPPSFSLQHTVSSERTTSIKKLPSSGLFSPTKATSVVSPRYVQTPTTPMFSSGVANYDTSNGNNAGNLNAQNHKMNDIDFSVHSIGPTRQSSTPLASTSNIIPLYGFDRNDDQASFISSPSRSSGLNAAATPWPTPSMYYSTTTTTTETKAYTSPYKAGPTVAPNSIWSAPYTFPEGSVGYDDQIDSQGFANNWTDNGVSIIRRGE